MIEIQKSKGVPGEKLNKCDGWQLGQGGHPIDPCSYNEIGTWINKMKGVEETLLVCEKCGYPSIGWVNIGEERADFDEQGELLNP